MKVCSKCKIEKEEVEFGRGCCKDGLRSRCKECRKKYENRDKEYTRMYYLKNKNTILDKQKKYGVSRKEEKKIYDRNYNKQKKVKERKKIFDNFYRKKRRKIDPAYKLKTNISNLIRHYILKNNGSKQGLSILQYLPYTIQQLRERLETQWEPWMNWDNYGPLKIDGIKRWNIDHIIPQSKLPYDSMEHPNFQKCWSLENLQPLEALENTIKGDNEYESFTIMSHY